MHTVRKVLRAIRTKGQADDWLSLECHVLRACFDDIFLAEFLMEVALSLKSIGAVGRLLTPDEVQTIVRKGATPEALARMASNPTNLIFVRHAVLLQIENNPKDVAIQWTSARCEQDRRARDWQDLRDQYEQAVVPRTARLAREER